MSIKRKLGKAGLCLLLSLGPLAGGFMSPQDIEELIHGTNQQKMAYLVEEEQHQGDEPNKDAAQLP